MTSRLAPEVEAALSEGAPVVALESTIIAHGFPEPHNLDVARSLEVAVRAEGAIPATIGVVDGDLVIGLDEEQLIRMATETVLKVNVANLAVCMAKGQSGATTVSATVRAARIAGIPIVATGGIGGVHRGDHSDVSADLPELACGSTAVVSSGAKAFLDVAATMEYLETAGVTVIGYRTDEFPAFYSGSSGIPLPYRVDSPAEAAAVIEAAAALGGAGVLIANPIDPDAALDPADVAVWTEAATVAADADNIEGLSRTPFILRHIAQLSGGRAVAANAALATSNATLAAQIAVER